MPVVLIHMGGCRTRWMEPLFPQRKRGRLRLKAAMGHKDTWLPAGAPSAGGLESCAARAGCS